MPFSDILSEPTAPKGGGAVVESAIGGLAKVATAVVSEFKDVRQKTIVESAVEDINKEEQRLKAALQQGKLTGGINEYVQRLSVKQREISANFPSVAAEIRAGIKESLGVLPTTLSPAMVIKEEERKQGLKDKALGAAVSAGLGVNKPDGNLDEEGTLSNFNELMRAKQTLDFAVTNQALNKSIQGTPLTESEKYEKLDAEYGQFFGSYKNTYYNPMLQQLSEVLRTTKGGDEKKYADTLATFNQISINYLNDVRTELDKSPLPSSRRKAIEEREKANIDANRELLFSGDFAVTNERLNTYKKVIENTGIKIGMSAPGIVAINKELGPNAQILIGSSMQANLKWLATQDALATSIGSIPPSTILTDTSDAALGRVDPVTLPPERKAAVARSLTSTVQGYAASPNLAKEDLRTMAGSASALAKLIITDGSPADTAKAIRQLDNSTVYSRLFELSNANHEFADFGRNALASMQQLADSALKSSVGVTRNPYAEALYNPNTGKFDVVPTGATNTKVIRGGLPVDMTRGDINALAPEVDTLNRALNMATFTSAIKGDTNELEIRQHLIDMYGFKTNPSHRKRTVSDAIKEAINPTSTAAPTGTGGWTVKLKGE